jgi:hypothetical protein
MSEYFGGPFIYSTGGSLTCSICAPDYASAEDIEAFAYLQLGATEDGNQWRVFDKSKLEFLQPERETIPPSGTRSTKLFKEITIPEAYRPRGSAIAA